MPLPPTLDRRQLLRLAAIGLLPPAAIAQTPAPAPAAPLPRLRGVDREGRVFDLATQRERVVMVMFWSTACAVCRDKMPELRANLRGWQGQAFTLVGVNTDPQRRTLDEWEALVALTVPADQRFTQLWRGDPRHDDGFGAVGTLPATYLIDKQGRVARSFQGRVPAETWDHVADLL
jgi:peroxiredoxin